LCNISRFDKFIKNLLTKKIEDVKIVLLGAGASNTTIARIIISAGGDPKK